MRIVAMVYLRMNAFAIQALSVTLMKFAVQSNVTHALTQNAVSALNVNKQTDALIVFAQWVSSEIHSSNVAIWMNV